MEALSRMILCGSLATDPTISYTKEEVPIARFRLKVEDKKKSKKPQTFLCVATKGLASIIAEYLKKGSLVAVEGKLKVSMWQRESEIIIDNMLMLDKKFYGAEKEAESK